MTGYARLNILESILEGTDAVGEDGDLVMEDLGIRQHEPTRLGEMTSSNDSVPLNTTSPLSQGSNKQPPPTIIVPGFWLAIDSGGTASGVRPLTPPG